MIDDDPLAPRYQRERDDALRLLRANPDFDELHIVARKFAYHVGYVKPRELRHLLLEAMGVLDDTHPMRAGAERIIKREFREVADVLGKAQARRDAANAREARRVRLLEDEQDREWARREAKRLEGGGDDIAAEVYVDIAQVLEGSLEPSAPDAGGVRADGERMLYRGKVNGLVGEPEAGKTLTAIAMAADELAKGGSVLHIDADHNGAADIVARYLAALEGTSITKPRKVLANPSRFRLVAPETTAGIRSAIDDAASWQPTIAIVDSVGEVVPMFGGDSRSEDDYTRIHREVFTPLAESGAAVLVLDHVAKTALGTGYATGTGAKKRAMNGAYYGVKSLERFSPAEGGAAALTILKDRPGGVRAKTPSETAAVFRLTVHNGAAWSWEFHPGRSEDDRAADHLAADVAFVLALDPFPASRTALHAAVRDASPEGKGWNNERASAALKAARSREATTFPLSGTPSDD